MYVSEKLVTQFDEHSQALRYYQEIAFDIRTKPYFRGWAIESEHNRIIQPTENFERLIKSNLFCRKDHSHIVQNILYDKITHEFINAISRLEINELSPWYSEILISIGFMIHNITHPDHYLDGESLILSGLFQYAAVNLNPNNYKAYNNLGYVLSCLEDYDNAKLCYEKAIAINHLYILTRFNLAHLLAASHHDHEEACRQLKATALLLDQDFLEHKLTKETNNTLKNDYLDFVIGESQHNNTPTKKHLMHTFTELISEWIEKFERKEMSIFECSDNDSDCRRKLNYSKSLVKLGQTKLNLNRYSYFNITEKQNLEIEYGSSTSNLTINKT